MNIGTDMLPSGEDNLRDAVYQSLKKNTKNWKAINFFSALR